MAGLFQVFNAAFLLPAAYVLNDASLKVSNTIFVDVLYRLDFHILVVTSANLYINSLFANVGLFIGFRHAPNQQAANLAIVVVAVFAVALRRIRHVFHILLLSKT